MSNIKQDRSVVSSIR